MKFTSTTQAFVSLLEALDWRDEDGLPFREETLDQIIEEWEEWFLDRVGEYVSSGVAGIFIAITPSVFASLLEKYLTKYWEDFLQHESQEQALAFEIDKIAKSPQVFKVNH